MKRRNLIFWPASLGVLFFALQAAAQLPGVPSAGTQTSTATQLPVSGRGAQNGSVTATQSAVPGTTTSVNTLNTSIQTQGSYAGSASSAAMPFTGKLSLREAIHRGLAYNLGQALSNQNSRQSRGQARVARSALLPNLNGTLSETEQQSNLRISGIRINTPFPGLSIPTIVGPFNYFDLRARLTQTIVNFTQWNNYRSAAEIARSNEQAVRDARDLVVLAVGGAYLQVIAAQARLTAERAQFETADALFKQASEQRAAGVLSLTDLNRSEVQLLTERQRLVSLENDLAKLKINLARLIGLPADDSFSITDDVPFTPAPPVEEAAALRQAFEQRADLKAAEAQIRAARYTHAAARAERLPSLSLNADYGANGMTPSQSHGTFSVTGTLTFPIWQGGRAEGDIEEASAALAHRRSELEDARSRIEADVRSALLDLRAAAQQVAVAERNISVAAQNLDLTRQRLAAGVSDNVEVVQAQQSVASAQLDYINSVFAHNVAKLSLARALGGAAENFEHYLTIR